MDRGYPHSLIKEKKLLSEIKFTERESALLKQNNKERREIGFFCIAFRDTILIFSVYFKRSFNEKVESFTMKQVMGSAFL